MKKSDLTLVCRQNKAFLCNFRIVLEGYLYFLKFYLFIFALFNEIYFQWEDLDGT